MTLPNFRNYRFRLQFQGYVSHGLKNARKIRRTQCKGIASEYHKAFQEQILKTESDKKRFRDEVFSVQGAVVDELRIKWTENDDFKVSWDFNYCYHACGGIYSKKIFCKDYVVAIRDALRSVDEVGRWTYHTACEIEVNPDGKTAAEATEDRGEFFVRGDICYINGATMKPEWRARLGCPD